MLDNHPIQQTLSKVIPQGMFWTKRWHLVSGCTAVSPGCAHCWMCREAKLRENHPAASVRRLHEGLLTGSGQWNGSVRFNEHVLQIPFLVRTPQIFAIWTDLFHESVTDNDIDRVMAVIMACHTLGLPHLFIAPTKRAERQLRFFTSRTPAELIHAWRQLAIELPPTTSNAAQLQADGAFPLEQFFPLSNLIGCMTTENQDMADQRLPAFLVTPFRTRVILAEPLLGLLSMAGYDGKTYRPWLDKFAWETYKLIHGVITGGESGHGSRPSHQEWFRTLRDQCAVAGVPFFFKGWGEWLPEGQQGVHTIDTPDEQVSGKWHKWPDGSRSLKTGKKTAGRLLDGIEYNELYKEERK